MIRNIVLIVLCVHSGAFPISQNSRIIHGSNKYIVSNHIFSDGKFHTNKDTPIPLRNSNDNGDTSEGRASVSLTGLNPSGETATSATSFIDYALSILTSDIGSIVLGLIGLCLALYNRLSSIDYEATSLASDASTMMGMQSRSDLLAVFASGAVLLNGISKLDVTSALAERVVLDGVILPEPIIQDDQTIPTDKTRSLEEKEKDVCWAIDSALAATPASSAVILFRSDLKSSPTWTPVAMGGVVPPSSQTQILGKPLDQRSPVLDRFLNSGVGVPKESYLPTLQALPGKVEFTYLPSNTQETLLLPIAVTDEEEDKGEQTVVAVLALGSDTAKSFSPRDIAWCQVLARRMANEF